jgi:hypothetical protein
MDLPLSNTRNKSTGNFSARLDLNQKAFRLIKLNKQKLEFEDIITLANKLRRRKLKKSSPDKTHGIPAIN